MRYPDPTRLNKPRLRCDMQQRLLEALCNLGESDTTELARITKMTKWRAATMLRRMQDQRLVARITKAKSGPAGHAAKWQIREAFEKSNIPPP